MKKAMAMKWVRALRSGKYKQGTSRLKTTFCSETPEYCCLGVLCEITNSKFRATQGFLPQAVVRKTGMLDPWSGEVGRIEQGALINMNDVRNYSFKSIANYIEKNWKKL